MQLVQCDPQSEVKCGTRVCQHVIMVYMDMFSCEMFLSVFKLLRNIVVTIIGRIFDYGYKYVLKWIILTCV